ncbi:hypothetical protein [Mucilaginibacter sp. KACC 22063]|uniref:hypothetical protein n=1 Tax=Mucilaginibacter sp. KACC 22063 TaxID=3025666 RepID=UPI002366990B|nr:hypothetical protein [Mucilaginibacter sp. KACC 22063]WDF54866.1 hypothetical protein PQ461_18210 [Mucilaginibacter sp. KACC 22063]
MKQNKPSKPVMALLIIGVLMVTTTPIISKHFFMPDSVRGFIYGLGLALEVIAIIKFQQSKKTGICNKDILSNTGS